MQGGPFYPHSGLRVSDKGQRIELVSRRYICGERERGRGFHSHLVGNRCFVARVLFRVGEKQVQMPVMGLLVIFYLCY